MIKNAIAFRRTKAGSFRRHPVGLVIEFIPGPRILRVLRGTFAGAAEFGSLPSFRRRISATREKNLLATPYELLRLFLSL
jgi:hypothetical protein